MIQIFFNEATAGPQKVISNLLSGLKLIHEPYICNPLDLETDDPAICLNDHLILNSDLIEHLVIGPNICVLPIDNPVVLSQQYKKTIVPSGWVYNKYKRYISESMLEVWPVGIDAHSFPRVEESFEPLFDCLIYFKRRTQEELDKVKTLLNSLDQKWTVIEYGNYSEEEFKKVIKNSRYCFSLNGTESQGIAIQEIMSSNLPIFVWDIDSWKDRGEEHECPATSVPYWSKMCGEKTSDEKRVVDKFSFFLDNLEEYSPRKFITENLSLEKQAEELANILKQ
jgi:hypothetical protein